MANQRKKGLVQVSVWIDSKTRDEIKRLTKILGTDRTSVMRKGLQEFVRTGGKNIPED